MVRINRLRRPDLRDQQGMALLITVMTVALLTAVTLQYHKTTWDKYLASHNYMTGSQLTAIADSGIRIALAVLESDPAEVDSLHDGWAALDQEPFRELFPAGTLKLRVDDLSGRLPINTIVQREGQGGKNEAVAQILARLLRSGAFPSVEDDTMAEEIVDAIVDWIDEDDKESDFGAENSYYQSLSKPYTCKNRPLDYIEELLLVRGITPELLFGSGKNPGLAEFLTVFATEDGKINLNTAAPLLIRCLDPLVDDNLAQDLVDYRKGKENKELADPGWYKNIIGWGGITLPLVTTKSSFFQVTAAGTFDNLSRRMVASVERSGPGEVKLLVKKME